MTLEVTLKLYYDDYNDWPRWNRDTVESTLIRRIGPYAPRSGGFYIVGRRDLHLRRETLGSVMIENTTYIDPVNQPIPHAFRYTLTH